MNSYWLGMAIGFFLGALFGVLVMAIMNLAKKAGREIETADYHLDLIHLEKEK